MTKDDREIVQRLFAVATGVASEAVEAAVMGQNGRISLERAAAIAARLEGLAASLLSLASAIQVCAQTPRRQSRPN